MQIIPEFFMKGPKRMRIFLGRALYVESRVIYQYLMGELFFAKRV